MTSQYLLYENRSSLLHFFLVFLNIIIHDDSFVDYGIIALLVLLVLVPGSPKNPSVVGRKIKIIHRTEWNPESFWS
jgi:hypothetical protein